MKMVSFRAQIFLVLNMPSLYTLHYILMKSCHTLAAFFPSLVVGPDDDGVVGAGEVLTASFSGAGEAGLAAESTTGTSGDVLAAGTSLGSASAVGAAKKYY